MAKYFQIFFTDNDFENYFFLIGDNNLPNSVEWRHIMLIVKFKLFPIAMLYDRSRNGIRDSTGGILNNR